MGSEATGNRPAGVGEQGGAGEQSDVDDEGGLGAQVRSTVGRLYRRFRSERPEGSLGDATIDILVRLHKIGPQTLTELSEYGRVAPASMSQSVNRLTSTGYAVRTPDPTDRRKVLLRTTAEGAALARDVRTRRNAWLADRLDALTPEEKKVIARACDLLSTIADS